MKRYYATASLTISVVEDENGVPRSFKAGEELLGVPASRIPNLLRTGQAEAREVPDSKPVPAPQVVHNKPVHGAKRK